MTNIYIALIALGVVIIALIYNQLQLKKLVDCLEEQSRRKREYKLL